MKCITSNSHISVLLISKCTRSVYSSCNTIESTLDREYLANWIVSTLDREYFG